ncbi:uncharacterized protein LOC132713318 isoform X3 [Ruditapes philippinarum]|nr:uncharacterized protein LOC132713318 isoform X3 [Ruditapes philippinarum]XP_060551843.1 uncharacterized protein LOC132713318 isoform X3 [Ruditapes philippinarum]XP_060551844.1 uncharacterized protein LOC132713318 isoform X3 [Ruditapes philippinarum]XP_060551845.1 uncharacterized protein LOC132713318 isoform X3 [Ruditapes philippinarum]
MAHEIHIKNNKYRQWVKAGLGLGYLKEGLAPFCDGIGRQQHKDIINQIQQTKTPQPNIPCGACQITTLQPDHVRVSKGICPLKQDKCNCCFPNNKGPCPNNICGAIYDSIIQYHASMPPVPFWKNSDVQQWSEDPWSVIKCFINAPGYKDKTSAVDTDCTGLLHVIINNKYFHSHIGCNVTGPNNLFSKVRQYRNEIFHSSNMELEESKANCYIDDMIAVLQDGKELLHRQDAQQAVVKLQDLKKKEFIITTEDFKEILTQIKENAATKEEYEELKHKFTELKAQVLEAEKERTEMKRKITVLETEQKEEIKRRKVEESPKQKQLKYENAKSGCRTQLMEHYRSDVLKVSAIPLQPDEENYNFSDVYIRPTITSKIEKNRGESEEKEIESMSEIFTKSGDPQKFIYVVGDAGSGKSSFCKYLINCWCMAHSDGHNEDDEFEEVKEMKKFDFMFYISLRHNIKIRSIQEMLEMRYDKIKNLSKLLENDSEKIIILLDGLDEWSFDSETRNEFQAGLPERDFTKKYTIVTTSRPWKIHSLRVSNREIHQLLKFKGFDKTHEKEMIKNTITALNESLDPNVCEEKLRITSLVGLKQVPIMLQQLVCLWCDGKLDKTSRCAIYTGMLELYFTWNINKTLGNKTECMESSQNVELPQYLTDVEIFRLNSHLINGVSRLAYETLFNYSKDKSLTFDKSVFDDLKISHEMRETCLKLGILTEDKCPSFSVSKPKSSVFSFIHKSMQEFLAAVYIGINFNAKIGLSDSTGNVELVKKFICEVFRKCSTVNDILEQSNVIIMLSGLEPRLATCVSKYIYDTVSEDSRVQEYRRTIRGYMYRDHSCITDIQKLMFESMKELNATCSIGSNPVFYIGDLVIDKWGRYCDIVCSGIDQQQIVPDSVLSINVSSINTNKIKFTKYLPMFHHLEKIKITYKSEFLLLSSTQSASTQNNELIDEISNCVCETIKVNTSTLKSLTLHVSYTGKYYPVCKTVVSYLPSMINLVAIRMSGIKMSHDDTTTFCNFLERTSHLEQIQLINVKCECEKQHDVNLSKHQQLQYLDLYNTVSVIDADTTNLEIFEFSQLKDSNYEKIFDIIRKSYKLKELELHGEYNNKSQLYHTNITNRLVRVLPLLHNLSKLKLWHCRFTDNIIQLPLEMKSLKNIKLYNVIMSLTTWRKFVDSFPGIPHTVYVRVEGCYITGDGEEFDGDRLTLIRQALRGGKGNDAIQYVKDKDQLFHVKLDSVYRFEFSTKK